MCLRHTRLQDVYKRQVFTTIVGLCVANAFTGLSGCLLAQYQKSVNIDIGSGMVTIALASLLIGATILGRGKIVTRAVGVVRGSFIFRLVYTIAPVSYTHLDVYKRQVQTDTHISKGTQCQRH